MIGWVGKEEWLELSDQGSLILVSTAPALSRACPLQPTAAVTCSVPTPHDTIQRRLAARGSRIPARTLLHARTHKSGEIGDSLASQGGQGHGPSPCARATQRRTQHHAVSNWAERGVAGGWIRIGMDWWMIDEGQRRAGDTVPLPTSLSLTRPSTPMPCSQQEEQEREPHAHEAKSPAASCGVTSRLPTLARTSRRLVPRVAAGRVRPLKGRLKGSHMSLIGDDTISGKI